MTCIVGMIDKENKRMYMGGDSAGVGGLNITVRGDVKVFRNGPTLIGYTSSFRMGQLLRFKFKVPENKKKTDYEFMCTDFIDEVKKVFKENGYSTVQNNVEEGGTFLVAYNGVIYSIQSDFQVGVDVEEFDTCGCGMYYATGALDILKDVSTLSTKEKVRTALTVAAKRSGGVQGPFNIISKAY